MFVWCVYMHKWWLCLFYSFVSPSFRLCRLKFAIIVLFCFRFAFFPRRILSFSTLSWFLCVANILSLHTLHHLTRLSFGVNQLAATIITHLSNKYIQFFSLLYTLLRRCDLSYRVVKLTVYNLKCCNVCSTSGISVWSRMTRKLWSLTDKIYQQFDEFLLATCTFHSCIFFPHISWTIQLRTHTASVLCNKISLFLPLNFWSSRKSESH